MNENQLSSVKLKKDDAHKKVEDTVNSIIKQMSSLFESIKLTDDKNIEDHNNLEISVSSESISNKVDSLLEIIESLKIEKLKNSDITTHEKMIESLDKTANEKKGILKKIVLLQDQFNIMNNHLIEMENSKFYKYAFLYNE